MDKDIIIQSILAHQIVKTDNFLTSYELKSMTLKLLYIDNLPTWFFMVALFFMYTVSNIIIKSILIIFFLILNLIISKIQTTTKSHYEHCCMLLVRDIYFYASMCMDTRMLSYKVLCYRMLSYLPGKSLGVLYISYYKISKDVNIYLTTFLNLKIQFS